MMVCGPRRVYEGSHPFMNANGPSFLMIVAMVLSMPCASPGRAFMTRVLTTSNGEQIVVATRPCTKKL